MLRVAVIGTGFFSQYHYDAWNRLPEVKIVSLCGKTNEARARSFAEQYGVPSVYLEPAKMLDEVRPDLVDIVTPPDTHLELVRLAAERHIPIVCQKPLAPSLEEARAVVEAAEKTGTPLIVHENWRFKPWFREMRRLLADGMIGEPYAISFRMRPGDGRGPRAYMDRQPYFQKMPRFLIHETGIHMIDVFRFLLGEVRGVFARLRRLNPVIRGEDAGYVIFQFHCGAEGLFDGNRLAEFPAENPRLTMGVMLLEGSEGYLRLDGYGRLWYKPNGKEEVEHPYQWSPRGYGGDAVYALQKHVVEHLTHGTPVENTGREYLRNIIVEEAIYRSNAERRWIDLDCQPD